MLTRVSSQLFFFTDKIIQAKVNGWDSEARPIPRGFVAPRWVAGGVALRPLDAGDGPHDARNGRGGHAAGYWRAVHDFLET